MDCNAHRRLAATFSQTVIGLPASARHANYPSNGTALHNYRITASIRPILQICGKVFCLRSKQKRPAMFAAIIGIRFCNLIALPRVKPPVITDENQLIDRILAGEERLYAELVDKYKR